MNLTGKIRIQPQHYVQGINNRPTVCLILLFPDDILLG